MNINFINQEIRNDIFYDMIPYMNARKNLFLLHNKICLFLRKSFFGEKLISKRTVISNLKSDFRDKSIARLVLLSPFFDLLGVNVMLWAIKFAPLSGLSAIALLIGLHIGLSLIVRLAIAIYDIAYRRFYNEEYLLEKIKREPEIFWKADPELKTNLEFILKALDQNGAVADYIPHIDVAFIQMLTKKGIPLPSKFGGQAQELINRFYCAALKEESIPNKGSIVTENPSSNWDKLPADMLQEIINQLSVASTTRFSMTSKKFQLLIEPVLTSKVNIFFKNEVNHLIRGIKIYQYVLENTQLPRIYCSQFEQELQDHIKQFNNGSLSMDLCTLQDRRFSRAVDVLNMIQTENFEDLPQEVNLPNFNRIERIKCSILFAFKDISSAMRWRSDHSLEMGKDKLSYLALELVSS